MPREHHFKYHQRAHAYLPDRSNSTLQFFWIFVQIRLRQTRTAIIQTARPETSHHPSFVRMRPGVYHVLIQVMKCFATFPSRASSALRTFPYKNASLVFFFASALSPRPAMSLREVRSHESCLRSQPSRGKLNRHCFRHRPTQRRDSRHHRPRVPGRRASTASRPPHSPCS